MKILIAILFCLMVTSSSALEDSHHFKRLKATNGTPDSLDFFFQLLNGLKADDFVPGSVDCSLDILATNTDY